jgi:hypothetical protein
MEQSCQGKTGVVETIGRQNNQPIIRLKIGLIMLVKLLFEGGRQGEIEKK